MARVVCRVRVSCLPCCYNTNGTVPFLLMTGAVKKPTKIAAGALTEMGLLLIADLVISSKSSGNSISWHEQ